MSALSDILVGMEGKIQEETGWSWEALERLYEETGYGQAEIYDLFEEFKAKEDAEVARDYNEFFDFATNSCFEWDDEGTLVVDDFGKIKKSNRKFRPMDKLLQLFFHGA